MAPLRGQGSKAGLDIPQAILMSDLRVEHSNKLLPRREGLHVAVAILLSQDGISDKVSGARKICYDCPAWLVPPRCNRVLAIFILYSKETSNAMLLKFLPDTTDIRY